MDYRDWRAEFERLVGTPRFDLAKAALVIAADEYPQLAVEQYLERLDRMAEHVRPYLPADRNPDDSIQVLNRYLFKELAFSGNTQSYYDPRNSYLNDVLDRKLGLPITLSIVYLSIGDRLGMPVFGVGLPGHFVVKWQDSSKRLFVDPFNKGEVLDVAGLEARVKDTYAANAQLSGDRLTAVDVRYILIRLLNNLKLIFVQSENYLRAWQVVDKLLLLDPASPQNVRDMGLLSLQVGAFRQAATYLEEYLLAHADAQDADRLRIYLRTAASAASRLN